MLLENAFILTLPSTNADSQPQKSYERWKGTLGTEELDYSSDLERQQEQGKVMQLPSELFTLTLSPHLL